MKDTKGTTFEILRFSLNDGPGIRTTVFFKGCPLTCWWCHNYESQTSEKLLYFDPSKCTLCGNCAMACPSSVHSLINQTRRIDLDKCNLSYECVEVCPRNSLKIMGKEYTSGEIFTEVLKDRNYFAKSGGGVTISGGEPMQQFHFLLELLELFNKEGIHTCLDTSGFASKAHFSKIMHYVDLFHYDIKLFDNQQHKRYTGVNNTSILQNLEFLAHNKKPIILRCPIIPGINDHKSHFEKLASLASRYHSIQKVDLLPYHKMGLKKEALLHHEKNVPSFRIPSDQEQLTWKNLVSRKTCKPVFVGGR